MQKRSSKSGMILALIFITLVVGVFFVSRGTKDDTTVSTENTSNSTANTPTDQSDGSVGNMRRESKNVERKNDALKVAAAVNEFMNNNHGTMPTGWSAGALTGASGSYPATFTLTAYGALTVVSGSQPAFILTSRSLAVAL